MVKGKSKTSEDLKAKPKKKKKVRYIKTKMEICAGSLWFQGTVSLCKSNLFTLSIDNYLLSIWSICYVPALC